MQPPAGGFSLSKNLPQKAIQTKLALLCVEFVWLVLLYELLCSRWISIGIEDLIETWIALRLVEKLHQLRNGHAFALRVAHTRKREGKVTLLYVSIKKGMPKRYSHAIE